MKITDEIPDAAVQAALDKWMPVGIPDGDMFEDMRAALTAALPHLPLGYEVKQLEWVAGDGLSAAKSYYEAKANGLTYCLIDGQCWIEGLDISIQKTGTEKQAKAAAQADFERRVRECLVAKPLHVAAVRRQALEEASSRLIYLADKAREMERRLHAKQHDGKYGDRKKQHFYEEKKHFKRLSIGYYKSVRAILALSAEPAQGEQWNPIETCPPDNVLFYGKDRHGDSRVFEGFRAVNGTLHVGDKDSKPVKITHWMPLPAAPTSEAGR